MYRGSPWPDWLKQHIAELTGKPAIKSKRKRRMTERMLEAPVRKLILELELKGFDGKCQHSDIDRAIVEVREALADLDYQRAKYAPNKCITFIKCLTFETTIRGKKRSIVVEPGDVANVVERKEKGLVCALRNDLNQVRFLVAYPAEKRQWLYCLPDAEKGRTKKGQMEN